MIEELNPGDWVISKNSTHFLVFYHVIEILSNGFLRVLEVRCGYNPRGMRRVSTKSMSPELSLNMRYATEKEILRCLAVIADE